MKKICMIVLLVLLLGNNSTVAFSYEPVVLHGADGTLIEGLNILIGGLDFTLPAAMTGARYLIANDSGKAVNIIPSGPGQYISSLPLGHKGILSYPGKLEVIGFSANGYYLWQGTVSDGGDPHAAGHVKTNFSENPLGPGIPTGWTERWATGVTNYAIRYSAENPGQKELKVTTSTMGRRLLTYNAADNLGADVDLLMLFKDPINEGVNHTDIRLQARSSGGSGSENGYYFTTLNAQTRVGIYKYVGGVMTDLKSVDSPFNTTDRWWVRFRIEGDSLKAKIWPYGSVEPTCWQLAVIDTDIMNPGWQGIGNYYFGDHLYYDFSASALPASAEPASGYGIIAIHPNAVNMDAETGNTDGWVNEVGILQVAGNYKRSGNYGFQGTAQNYRAYQRIDLAVNRITQANLNDGAVISFRAWQRAFSNSNDPGRIGVRFLDIDGKEILSLFTPWDGKSTFWIYKNVEKAIPTSAAYVDIILEGKYAAGDTTGAYFDDLEVAIAIKSSN